MRSMRAVLISIIMGCLSTACGSDDDSATPNDAGAKSTDQKAPGPKHEVSCIDESFAQLALFEEPSGVKPVEEDKQNGSFYTSIDATGGGLSPTKSFVYARFTQQGLKAVAISDDEAFDSLDWDIALRRYVIRINSGVSGPGNVTAARTAPRTDFDSLAKVPDALEYRTEEYFGDTCEFVSDGSGIGSPATALASFWSYSACVAMTHNVYVLALPGSRHVKLEVLNYYTPDKQQVCDETGMVPAPSGAGNLLIRWNYLD
jgi:hypothetical protein